MRGAPPREVGGAISAASRPHLPSPRRRRRDLGRTSAARTQTDAELASGSVARLVLSFALHEEEESRTAERRRHSAEIAEANEALGVLRAELASAKRQAAAHAAAARDAEAVSAAASAARQADAAAASDERLRFGAALHSLQAQLSALSSEVPPNLTRVARGLTELTERIDWAVCGHAPN